MKLSARRWRQHHSCVRAAMCFSEKSMTFKCCGIVIDDYLDYLPFVINLSQDNY